MTRTTARAECLSALIAASVASLVILACSSTKTSPFNPPAGMQSGDARGTGGTGGRTSAIAGTGAAGGQSSSNDAGPADAHAATVMDGPGESRTGEDSGGGLGGMPGSRVDATDGSVAGAVDAVSDRTQQIDGPVAFPGCPACRRIFDGTTLNGWTPEPVSGWDIKDGSIHTTGTAARGYLYTNQDYGDYRIILSVRQLVGDHDPPVLFFGTRPPPAIDALGAVQFQLPNHWTWDYRPGHNNDGGTLFTPQPHPNLDKTKWNQCEILVKASTGEARMTCCELVSSAPCIGVEHNRFRDPTAGKTGPFAMQIHNAGIQDEYKDIFIETNPTVDGLITIASPTP